jgi:hypothetical protein
MRGACCRRHAGARSKSSRATGRVDLDEESVAGGTMDGWWLAVNWWATRTWKASVGYGNVDLDRNGVEGNTQELLWRIQWIF